MSRSGDEPTDEGGVRRVVRLGQFKYREVSVVSCLGRPVEEIEGSGTAKPFLQSPTAAAHQKLDEIIQKCGWPAMAARRG